MTELDDAYANAAYISGADAFPDRWAAAALAFRGALGDNALRRKYGPETRNWFDLFLPQSAPKGVVVFVHGGYWLRFDASSWSHFAAGALARGWAVAMPCYQLCPDATIAEITQQIAAAVETIAWQFAGPIAMTGHSAGGHLVARMLQPGMLMPDTLVRITHVAPISPVADLRPLLRTSMNAQFKMDLAVAEAESPVLQSAPTQAVSVWVGADERPVFLDQAQALGRAWACPVHTIPDRHHFDIIDNLFDPNSALVQCLTP
ncbi:MAG: alpha/beta hydrolase [Paracoccaceae bacterium]